MSTLREIAKAFLNEEDILFSEDKEEIAFGIRTENCNIRLRIVINEEKHFFIIVGTFPNFYKQDDYSILHSTFNSYNMRTLYTKLFFDEADGEAYCSCSALTYENAYSKEMIKHYIMGTVSIIDVVYKELLTAINAKHQSLE